MKESIMLLTLVATGFFCSGQCSTDSVYAGTVVSVKVINVVPSETKSLTKEN